MGSRPGDLVRHIQTAIEYSHGKLDPAIQNSLMLLAPFNGTIPGGEALTNYQELLEQDPAVQALGPVDLPAAITETLRVGLANPHPELRGWVQVQPVLPYFLRTRLQQRPDLRQAVDQAHYQLYTDLARQAHSLLTATTPAQRETGRVTIRAQYENLTGALNHAVNTGQPVSQVHAEIAELMVEFGAKWGFDVSSATMAIALTLPRGNPPSQGRSPRTGDARSADRPSSEQDARREGGGPDGGAKFGGHHDESECGNVVRDLWLFLDDEMHPDAREEVRRHLESCSACLKVATAYLGLKKLLKLKAGGDRSPEQLRTRLVSEMRLASQVPDGGTQRQASDRLGADRTWSPTR